MYLVVEGVGIFGGAVSSHTLFNGHSCRMRSAREFFRQLDTLFGDCFDHMCFGIEGAWSSGDLEFRSHDGIEITFEPGTDERQRTLLLEVGETALAVTSDARTVQPSTPESHGPTLGIAVTELHYGREAPASPHVQEQVKEAICSQCTQAPEAWLEGTMDLVAPLACTVQGSREAVYEIAR